VNCERRRKPVDEWYWSAGFQFAAVTTGLTYALWRVLLWAFEVKDEEKE
jgi:hypothetical protein